MSLKSDQLEILFSVYIYVVIQSHCNNIYEYMNPKEPDVNVSLSNHSIKYLEKKHYFFCAMFQRSVM